MSRDEIIDYRNHTDAESARCLLLLLGPDGFEGSYDDYLEFERELKEE